MVYPRNFHRLVVIGDLYGTEAFNFTLSIAPRSTSADPMGPVTTELLDLVAGAVVNWWPDALGAGGVGIIQQARLQSVKLNRIGPNGLYVDAETKESIVGPVQGGSGVLVPAQLACAVSLGQWSYPRGRGSKGRFYLPPIGAFSPVSTDGRLSAANAMSVAAGAKVLIESINQAYSDADGFTYDHRVCIASNIGTGIFTAVDKVSVGRVPDTMRSRRSKLLEDYQDQTITI